MICNVSIRFDLLINRGSIISLQTVVADINNTCKFFSLRKLSKLLPLPQRGNSITCINSHTICMPVHPYIIFKQLLNVSKTVK